MLSRKLKLLALTCDFVDVDLNVCVSVRTLMLVHDPQSMQQLMDIGSSHVLATILAHVQTLLSTAHANFGEASAK